MRIISRKALRQFVAKNASTGVSVEWWYRTTRAAKWQTSADVLRTFPSASVIDAERVRFKISGDAFRLVCAIDYVSQTVWIKFLGTHKQYDLLAKSTTATTIKAVDMFKSTSESNE